MRSFHVFCADSIKKSTTKIQRLKRINNSSQVNTYFIVKSSTVFEQGVSPFRTKTLLRNTEYFFSNFIQLEEYCLPIG